MASVADSAYFLGKARLRRMVTMGSYVWQEGDLVPLRYRRLACHATHVRIGKVSDIRLCGEFRDWSLRFDVLHRPDMVDTDHLARIVRMAGEVTGLGDFRPARHGSFGTFEVVSHKEVTE
jgi:hypothetical protein